MTAKIKQMIILVLDGDKCSLWVLVIAGGGGD